MKINVSRLNNAIKAMGWHFLGSLLVALTVAVIVFGIWFPYPYRQLAGGTELFYLIMGVDIVCGPLLTLVLFNPAKPKRELFTDLSIVIVLQLAALTYGIWTVHQARPLYFVLEVDRFKVIALPNLGTVEQASQELTKLPEALQPSLFKGPQTVGLREASKEEREKVMFESVQGGRDYGERPGFYVVYNAAQAAKTYAKAKPLENFAKKHPSKQADIDKLQTQAGKGAGTAASQLRYLPIIARQDWVAVLNPKGEVVGYVQGDGF